MNTLSKIPIMKKIVLLLLLFTGMVNAQIVNIPDANFKAKLLEADVSNTIAMDALGNNIRIDTNNDGQIQETEALTVYRLQVRNAIIFNLVGISGFTNLTNLDCVGNILFNLDVSALTNLEMLNCSTNFIQTLDVSTLPNLKQLFCDNNRLTSINGLSGLTNLTRVTCNNNQLTGLNLSNSPGMLMLLCLNNNLTSLNVAGLANLTLLMCSANNLSSLDLTGLTSLQGLECSSNELTSLNVTDLTSLTTLNCFYNQLTSLDLSQSTALNFLSCGENNITNLNLNGLVNLNSLECSYLPNNVVINGANLNALTNFQYTGSNTVMTLNGFPNLVSMNLTLPQPAITVNLSGFSAGCTLYLVNSATTSLTINSVGTTHLGALNCSINQLTSLSLNGLSNLNTLHCSGNRLTNLNLTGLTGLTSLDFSRNKVTSVNLAGLPNLKHLDCNNNKLSSLDVSGLPALEYLDCSNSISIDIVGNQITSLNVAGLTNLKYLDCSNYGFSGQLGALGNQITSLNVNNLTQLEQLKCSKNNIPTLVVNGLVNLTHLDCSLNSLTSLDLIGLTNLTHLNYAYNTLSNLNMTGLVNITELNCSYNSISTLTVVNMPNLTKLHCGHNLINTLNLSGLTQLIDLNCDSNPLSSGLDLSSAPNLVSLNCNGNNLNTLDLSNVPDLINLNCNNNHLASLDLSNCLQLQGLYCSNNELTILSVEALTDLVFFQCDANNLTTLNISTLTNLLEFSCGSNDISNLDTQFLPNLRTLSCDNNLLTSIDVSQSPNLIGVYCNGNQIASIDVSNATRLTDLWCHDNPLLTTVLMKNGSYETNLQFQNNPLLTYICADESQLASVQSTLNSLGMTTTVSNSYCSFTPGGPHNTVIGTTIFDGNNNGCNINDPLHPNIRIDISDLTTTGSAFTNSEGNCTFYTDAGNYTMTPNIENASAFNISPASADVNFPNNNNNVSAISFCLSANGIHPDVEIAVIPVGPARPGFDAEYKVVYKNKGNQTLSGAIALVFEDDKIDFISAAPAEDSQAGNTLNWSYNGLLPFESRSIHVIFNVNSPVETPPVNNGDLLVFSASVTPVAGDEIPADNQFTTNQIVVGPFDPNDKTCLEGETVSTSQIGKYLHYTINFENLGTAEAVNVVIKDEIDTNTFDINTLQVMYASHEMQASIRGNKVEFIFKNINLAPAAGDPPVGGHGTILFKIKTLPTLENGSIAENTANIYFDYNAPIETNTARTTFSTLSTPEFAVDDSIALYPNPATDFISIKCDSSIKSVELFDIQGRILETKLEHKKETKLDVSKHSNGVYFVRISTEKGKRVEKIIKQ